MIDYHLRKANIVIDVFNQENRVIISNMIMWEYKEIRELRKIGTQVKERSGRVFVSTT